MTEMLPLGLAGFLLINATLVAFLVVRRVRQRGYEQVQCEFCNRSFRQSAMQRFTLSPPKDCPMCKGSGYNMPVRIYHDSGFHGLPPLCTWCRVRYACGDCAAHIAEQHYYPA